MVKIGDKIRIIAMDDCGYDLKAREYAGKEGEVVFIDNMGHLHGTWGGLAVIPDVDRFEVIG